MLFPGIFLSHTNTEIKMSKSHLWVYAGALHYSCSLPISTDLLSLISECWQFNVCFTAIVNTGQASLNGLHGPLESSSTQCGCCLINTTFRIKRHFTQHIPCHHTWVVPLALCRETAQIVYFLYWFQESVIISEDRGPLHRRMSVCVSIIAHRYQQIRRSCAGVSAWWQALLYICCVLGQGLWEVHNQQ